MAKELKDMVRQYERNRYSFSNFLGLAEQDELYRELQKKEYGHLPVTFFGGTETAERLILRIGSEETLGYEEPWPITLLEICPKNSKFSDDLTHRDFLGALMNLGLERDVLGDIFLSGNTAYVFLLSSMAPFVSEQLERVKHTSVTCKTIEKLPHLPEQEPEEKLIQVASLRADIIVAKTYNLSRNTAAQLFAAGKVFIDGRLSEHGSRELKPEEVVSVRGFGRLQLKEDRGLSRKGKRNLTVTYTK